MIRPRFPLRVATAAVRAGFTLIELIAVMLIISILAVFLVPQVPKWVGRAREAACQANLGEIGKGVLEYQMRFDRLPSESGVRFFAELFAADVFEQTEAAAKKLTCPAVDVTYLSVADLPPTEWYADLDLVDGGSSSYAGRDSRNHPMKRLSGKEALVADDNDGGMNHDNATYVLMGDQNVVKHDLVTLRRRGLLGEDEILRVGPDSQLEDLRKLSLD